MQVGVRSVWKGMRCRSYDEMTIRRSQMVILSSHSARKCLTIGAGKTEQSLEKASRTEMLDACLVSA
jgi:hypothetical protein